MQAKSIAVLSLNPGFDRTLYLDVPLEVGGHNRLSRVLVSQGSKGANQALLLSSLGRSVDYFSFGESDPFLEGPGIVGHYTPTRAGARINLKIVEPDGRGTEFNESGGPIQKDELDALVNRLLSRKYEVVSLCGSFPQGVESDVYNRLIKLLKERGSTVVLDTSGEALSLGAAACPELIKPNRQEIGVFGYGIPDSWETAAHICGKVREKLGCEIICTLDGDGSVYVGSEGIYRVTAEVQELRSFSAAGDSYLAAYTAARYLDGESVPTALHKGCAAATAKIALAGTEIPTAEQINNAMNAVKVEKI